MGRQSVNMMKLILSTALFAVASSGIALRSTCPNWPAGHTMLIYKGSPKECEEKTIYKGFSEAGKELIVKRHNELRQKVAAGLETQGNQPSASNMRKLVWNDELAETAQRFTDQCSGAHDKVRNMCDGTSVGQNFAWKSEWKWNGKWNGKKWEWNGEDSDLMPEEEIEKRLPGMVDMWYSEVKDFKAASASKFDDAAFKTSGHYTQVVWAETYAVGCGLITTKQRKPPMYFAFEFRFICNYATAGNYGGQPVYKVGDGCSACPSGTSCDSTFDKLCAATTAAAAPAADGLCILLGTCNIDPEVGDTIGLEKVLHNLSKDECHAKAAVEFKRCSNGDDRPITATYLNKDDTSSTISFPKRIGNCYGDWPTRLLPNHVGSTKTMVPSECNKMCAEKNFSYFGVQYYHECWCGNTAPQEDQQANIMKCDAPCVGDPNGLLTCGGSWFINIWKVCKDQDCKFSYE